MKKTMRRSGILRSLSSLCCPMRSAKVAPYPEHAPDSFTCHTTTLKDLKSLEKTKPNEVNLLHSVVGSIEEHKKVVNAISGPKSSDGERNIIEEYLENSVDLLDVCNFLLGKKDLVKRYVASVQRALELIQPGMGPAAVTRVQGLLGRKKCYDGDVSMSKCWSRLKRVVTKEIKRRRQGGDDDVLSLIGSMVNAFDVCKRLDTALSFNKRGWRYCAGRSTEQMVELRDVISLSSELRDLTVEDIRGHVEKLGKRCEELLQVVGPLEERVKELYSQLVAVRMALL